METDISFHGGSRYRLRFSPKITCIKKDPLFRTTGHQTCIVPRDILCTMTITNPTHSKLSGILTFKHHWENLDNYMNCHLRVLNFPHDNWFRMKDCSPQPRYSAAYIHSIYSADWTSTNVSFHPMAPTDSGPTIVEIAGTLNGMEIIPRIFFFELQPDLETPLPAYHLMDVLGKQDNRLRRHKRMKQIRLCLGEYFECDFCYNNHYQYCTNRSVMPYRECDLCHVLHCEG